MTAAVPDPRFRDQLAEVLEEFHGCGGDGPEDVMANDDLLDVLVPWMEARVQAAAKQGAAEERGRWITALGVLAARHSLRWFALELRDRAAALASPAPAPRAEEEGEYTGPCRFCLHPAGKHDVDAECWIEGCACGTGESGDPASAPPAAALDAEPVPDG